jgi:NAD kinase
MAFHLGSLGFLTPFEFDNFQEQVTNVLEGNIIFYTKLSHGKLQGTIIIYVGGSYHFVWKKSLLAIITYIQ